jgi:3-methyladenine DNA glycosylase AlkD
MTFAETMRKLESLGTEQNRKVYRRHGAGESLSGVSFADLNKLRKTIRTDHALALELWKSGNTDARTLATMIADPNRVTAAELDAWMQDIQYYMLADLFSGYVFCTRFAEVKMRQWMASSDDYAGQTGWNLLGRMAMQEEGTPDEFFAKHLETIEKKIHLSKNRTRHAMNGALIAIGIRNPKLEKLALAAAARIGKVKVDHGETGCKSPDAAAYIRKAVARKRRKI